MLFFGVSYKGIIGTAVADNSIKVRQFSHPRRAYLAEFTVIHH